MSFIDYLLMNYIWLVVVLVIIIITVIGFIADRRNNKKKAKQEQVLDRELVNEAVSNNMEEVSNETPLPDNTMVNWDNIDNNVNNDIMKEEIPSQVLPSDTYSQINPVNSFEDNSVNDQYQAPVKENVFEAPEMPYVSVDDYNVSNNWDNNVDQNNINNDFNYQPMAELKPEPVTVPVDPIPELPSEPITIPVNPAPMPELKPEPVIIPASEPSIPVSEPVYENEWDSIKPVESPKVQTAESIEDDDMWKL